MSQPKSFLKKKNKYTHLQILRCIVVVSNSDLIFYFVPCSIIITIANEIQLKIPLESHAERVVINMKTDLSCYLCFTKAEDIIDVFGEEGIRLNMKAILMQHYGFIPSIEAVSSAQLCACCWSATQEFHVFFSKIQSIWDLNAQNLRAIKMEVNVEPVEMSLNIPIDSEPVKLETNLAATENESHDSDEDGRLSCVSQSESVESEYIPKAVKRKKSTKISNKSLAKVRAKKPEVTQRSVAEKTEKKLKLANEDQQIREYFTMNCDVCGDHFETFLDIKRHFREKHEISGYVTCCGKKLIRRGALLEHISRHVNPDLFKCVECNKFFADAFSLKNHQDNHLPLEERPFKCHLCPNAFAKNYMLSQHLRLSHCDGDGQFTCDDCGKSYPKKAGLKNHIKNVHEFAFSIICDICAKEFKSKSSLSVHRLQHFDDDVPKVQCTMCGAWLKNERSLRKHINRHNSTQVKCTQCDKIAPNKPALDKHMKSVHTEAIFKCGLCEKAFKKAIALKEHMALHTGEDLYTCPYCPKTFKSNANMHSHRKKGHPIEFKADRERRLKP